MWIVINIFKFSIHGDKETSFFGMQEDFDLEPIERSGPIIVIAKRVLSWISGI